MSDASFGKRDGDVCLFLAKNPEKDDHDLKAPHRKAVANRTVKTLPEMQVVGTRKLVMAGADSWRRSA